MSEYNLNHLQIPYQAYGPLHLEQNDLNEKNLASSF